MNEWNGEAHIVRRTAKRCRQGGPRSMWGLCAKDKTGNNLQGDNYLIPITRMPNKIKEVKSEALY